MKAIFFVLFIVVQSYAFGQTSIHFGYDYAGNRISTYSAKSGIDLVGKSLNAESLFSNVSIYPNPANKTIFLEFKDEHVKHIQVKIFSVVGTLVLEDKLNSSAPGVNISELSSGMYFLNINCEGVKKTFKFIKE